MNLVLRTNNMRIKVQLFKDNDTLMDKIPFSTFHFKVTKNNEVEPCEYIRKHNDLEETIQYFIEDYLHYFLKEKDEKLNNKN